MLPLDQGNPVTHVLPNGICKTAISTRIEPGYTRLLLDRLEELMLVDFPVELSEDFLALIVP